MLERIGGECAGAVSFLPSGSQQSFAPYDYRSLDDAELASLLQRLPKQPLLAGEPGLRLSLAGVQNKMAVHIDAKGQMSLPMGGAPSTHIIKPASDHFDKLVLNEALCLALAEAVGIPAVAAEFREAQSIPYLLVERYDRLLTEGEPWPLRLHQEDFCQALGVHPDRKYQSEGGPSLKHCFDLVRASSSKPAVDMQHLLKTVALNMVVGNQDAQLRCHTHAQSGDHSGQDHSQNTQRTARMGYAHRIGSLATMAPNARLD